MNHVYRWSIAIVGLLSLAGAVRAQAEEVSSVAVSQKIVRFEAQAPDGHWVKGAVLEGDQFRMEDHSRSQALALVPLLQDDTAVMFRIFRIEKHGADGESMHFVEDLEVRPQEIAFTQKTAFSISIRKVSTHDPRNAEGEGPVAKGVCRGNVNQARKFGGGRCCVTCGSTTSCGCAVDDYCGSCCSGGCCAD